MELQYRDAHIEDLEAIVEIYNSTVPGRMVTADTEPVSVESRKPWFAVHEPLRRPLWMVEDGAELVGWVSFQSFYGRPAYLATAEISIYLKQEARGKGYGAKILAYAVGQCDRLGIKTLLGIIFSHNERSVKLFSRLGFDTWAHLPRIAILDGIERDVVIMGKRVNP